MDMLYKRLVNSLMKARHFCKGLLEVYFVETPRYSFVIQNIHIMHLDGLLRAELTFTPLGCYRPIKKKISELSQNFMASKFKPHHTSILLGIDTLERCLNLRTKEHCVVYLEYISTCIKRLHHSDSDPYAPDLS